jgi:hypothetical protein
VTLSILKKYATFIFKGATFLQNVRQCSIAYQGTEILQTIILKYKVRLIMYSKTQAVAGIKRPA